MRQQNPTNYFPYSRLYVLEKLPEMSRQELEAMFGIDDLKKTRFAQELMAEAEIV